MSAKVERCKICNGHVDDVGPLSTRKLCEKCSIARVTDAAYAMIGKSGPAYEKWRASMADYGRRLAAHFGEE